MYNSILHFAENETKIMENIMRDYLKDESKNLGELVMDLEKSVHKLIRDMIQGTQVRGLCLPGRPSHGNYSESFIISGEHDSLEQGSTDSLCCDASMGKNHAPGVSLSMTNDCLR